MNLGLVLQIGALLMLALPGTVVNGASILSAAWLTVPWVMAAQALSGIAKDLNKMSAKSSVKMLVPTGSADTGSSLYKWIALLTGSKNALKGVGFFLGGLLLTTLGFSGAMWLMAIALLLVWITSLVLLQKDLGRAKHKPKFSEIFSKSGPVNILSAARLFLFGARDVWFVVALPVFLSQALIGHWQSAAFSLVGWLATVLYKRLHRALREHRKRPLEPMFLMGAMPCWAAVLALLPATIALGLLWFSGLNARLSLLLGC